MTGVLGSATVKTALAAWLLLTNLSLGQYHQHEAGQDAHRAEPGSWHYHVLLLGVELEFLSVNSETCPFHWPDPANGEAHLLLGDLIAPATNHDADLCALAVLSLITLPHAASCDLAAARAPSPLPIAHEIDGLPPPTSVLTARSGVQQI